MGWAKRGWLTAVRLPRARRGAWAGSAAGGGRQRSEGPEAARRRYGVPHAAVRVGAGAGWPAGVAAAAGGVPRERQEPLRSRKTPEEGVQKSMVEEILALNKLKTEGILSEAEFSLAKAKLLGSKKKN